MNPVKSTCGHTDARFELAESKLCVPCASRAYRTLYQSEALYPPITKPIREVDEAYLVLMKARDLLTDPAAWTQRAVARNAERYWTSPSSEAAVSWCMDGGVRRAGNGYSPSAERRARLALASHTFRVPLFGRLLLAFMIKTPGEVLASFNDADSTRHQDVLKVIDRALVNA
jgi:hypothetical protein